jgi:plasmid stabilization system protein ParE
MHGDLSPVNRNVIIADRAVTAMERIIRQLQGASLIGAEKAKDEMLSRIRSLARNAVPSDARKARFDAIPGDIRSLLAHNHRIYYLIEEERVVVLDVILDAEIHSVEQG